MEFNTDFLDEMASLVVRELEVMIGGQTNVGIAEVEGVMRLLLQRVGTKGLGAYFTGRDEAYP